MPRLDGRPDAVTELRPSGSGWRANHFSYAARFLVLALPLSAAAQLVEHRAPVKLTLRQAIDIAVAPEGNTRIQLAAEGVRQAEARSAQARGALLPNFDASVAAQSQTRNLAAFGIQFNLPFPGFSIPTFVGPYTTVDARITGTQSVFDFSSIRRFQASKAGVRAARADTDSTRDQITAQVAGLYMNALAAQAQVEAAEANVDLAQALATLALNRKNAGTGTGIDVTRAEVQLANERQRLIEARNARRQAQLQLLRGMSMNLDTEIELTDTLSYAPVEDITLKDAVERAVASRPDLKAQQTRQDTARLSYSATKLERVPSVGSFADYGSIGTGLNSAVPTRTYGLALRVPLFDGGRRDARRSEAASQYRQEEIRTNDLKEQIGLELRLALDSLRSAGDQVKVAEEGLTQAEREVAQAQRRFSAGVAGSIETTDAQTRLERARANRISALLAYNLARINLGQAMGAVRQMIP